MDAPKSCSLTLSILIPVRNFDCTVLVERITDEIARESTTRGSWAELILGDDASTPSFRQLYEQLEARGLCRVFVAESNIGAGAMRNKLGKEAKGDFLLYLDSDTLPAKSPFLKAYMETASAATVVVGGFVYPEQLPAPEKSLRHKYGCLVESQSAEKRSTEPYSRFITMSFLIPRILKQQISFDDGRGMGYEDALFGFSLREAGIPVIHIDNPVLHDLKENNLEFLSTTRRYIENLYRLQSQFRWKDIKLLDAFRLVKRFGLPPLGAVLWRNSLFQNWMERRLCTVNPDLRLFSLYKLLYVCHLASINRNSDNKIKSPKVS